MYEQGDIVLIPFPYSDLSGAKQRPALIISNSIINNSEDRICCLVTSNPYKEGIEIKRSHFRKGKLPFKSWVKPHRIFTVHHNIIKRTLCTMSDSLHEKVMSRVLSYLRKE